MSDARDNGPAPQPVPRTVTRRIELGAPASAVWDALTDPALLSDWLAPETALEPRPGALLSCRPDAGEMRHGVVTRAEESRHLAFVWQRPDGPSHVDFRLEETAEGTVLTVTESAPTPGEAAAMGDEWSLRLESLRLCLASLAYA